MKIPGAVIAFVIIAALGIGVFLVLTSTTAHVPTTTAPGPGPVDGAPIGGAPGDAVPAGTVDATIDYVHDGDTLFLADGTKVRLLGIDTPEIGEHLECFGDEATQLLRDMLPEGTHVRLLGDVQPLDQYGRSLFFIYTDDDVNVNLRLIDLGAAEAVVLPPNLLFADDVEAAEDRAQAAGVGMWGAC